MSSIIRNDRLTTFPTLPESIMNDLTRALLRIRQAPLDVETLVKAIDIENFCTVMWGREKAKQALENGEREDWPKLSGEDLADAEVHPHGERGIVQEKGNKLFIDVCERLHKFHPEFKSLLGERQTYHFDTCRVLRFVSKSHDYEDEQAQSIVPYDLAKAHYFFGQASPTNQEGCPRKRQAALAMVGTMLWGVEGWKKYVEEVAELAKKGNAVGKLLGPEGLRQWCTDVEELDDQSLGNAATGLKLVIKAIAQIETKDRELAKILSWNVIGRDQEEEQVEESDGQQEGEGGAGKDEEGAKFGDRAEDELRAFRTRSSGDVWIR